MTDKNGKLLEPVVAAFSREASVQAIALSGGSVGNLCDELSDYDVYVYATAEVDVGWREKTAAAHAAQYDVNQQFYETTDDWLMPGVKTPVELIYRSPDWIEAVVDRVWRHGQASVGYSTCLVHNVKSSVILFDRDGWFRRLQETTELPYPEILRKNIIKKNLPMLSGRLNCSFDEQIRNALLRNDIVSVNHRISAFLASYFDVLFAMNRITHPGEKKLVPYALVHCPTLPAAFPGAIDRLVTGVAEDKLAAADELARGLKEAAKDIC